MRLVILVLAVAGSAGLCAFQETQPGDALPPDHPPVSPLPPGHPPVIPSAPGQAPVATVPAEAADVGSVQAVVDAYYDSISGPVGAPRDWDRFRSLSLPEARLMTLVAAAGGDAPLVLGPEQFMRMNRRYFESGGYSEQSIHEQLDEFSRVAHVWSTYEARRGDDAGPYSRGVTSFQLLHSGGRWWIVNVVWDRERRGLTLPPEYLPQPKSP